ncbi:hypothetical protein C4B68_17025 [Streptomyces dengpaensis]|uniref:Uncharacterized protein n=1 Tax=Streptomyces dengpaensis TaxID=2049881 RepID=A0ABM6SRD1_9ACTN|nr:hypothetical protein C4B68_17025 [Streptomyces dengpaensis]
MGSSWGVQLWTALLHEIRAVRTEVFTSRARPGVSAGWPEIVRCVRGGFVVVRGRGCAASATTRCLPAGVNQPPRRGRSGVVTAGRGGRSFRPLCPYPSRAWALPPPDPRYRPERPRPQTPDGLTPSPAGVGGNSGGWVGHGSSPRPQTPDGL